jgi:cell division transport system permease protein
MTVLLIGISLALPTALYLVVENGRAIVAGWERSAQISVFLRPEVDDARAQGLAESVRGWAEVGTVAVLGRSQALEEYKALAGVAGSLEALGSNPLPAVLLVQPADGVEAQGGLDRLVGRLATLAETDAAQFDQQWVRRLQAIVALVQRGVLVLAGLLGLGVLLAVANTTRLAIQGHRAEIEIMKLFGATDAFVRRPFLYTGLWYGLLGAAVAWLLLGLAKAGLQGPLERLALLYDGAYQPQGFELRDVLGILGLGGGLGLIGAWVAVGRHLKDIEPSRV